MTFTNSYRDPDDDGTRAGVLYSLHRAWGEITRDAESTRVPATIELDLVKMAGTPFAVSWLGHASLLLHVGKTWILVDPVFGRNVGPAAGLGPRRLAALPIASKALPHIDLVLISHDHFDHLELDEMRSLSRQAGGRPRFYAGSGLGPWFQENVGVEAEEVAWWDARREGDVELIFVPAQHSSGRGLLGKNRTLWGGWVVRYEGRCFYFAGDTAYGEELFGEIHERLGKIDVAAFPIGAYLPRDLMRYEHMSPREAVEAHKQLNPYQSFGVHWGTFQLGDEQPMEASTELLAATQEANTRNFGVAAIGAIIDVTQAASYARAALEPPIAPSLVSAPAI